MTGDRPQAEQLFFLSGGPLAAITLGIALVPLRGLTVASNFAFAFMALTIVVAEFGGRAAAVATAHVSALSLDFFLTRPYLRLDMNDAHDVIAFVGLAVCGLVAAAFGTHRGARLASLKASRAHLDLLHEVLRDVEGTASPGTRLAEVLKRSRSVLPLAGAVVRDEGGSIVASSDAAAEQRPPPPALLEADAWAGRALPEDGLRIALNAGGRTVGSLDVWAGGAPASPEAGRAVGDIARVVALLLATVGR